MLRKKSKGETLNIFENASLGLWSTLIYILAGLLAGIIVLGLIADSFFKRLKFINQTRSISKGKIVITLSYMAFTTLSLIHATADNRDKYIRTFSYALPTFPMFKVCGVFRQCLYIWLLFSDNSILGAWVYLSSNKRYTLFYTAELGQLNSIYTTQHETARPTLAPNPSPIAPQPTLLPWKTWCPGCTANKSLWINFMQYVGDRSQRHIYNQF